jgi:hypothetical protein
MVVMMTSQTACAQKVFQINHLLDSVLTLRYWRADIDTNYITRPQTKWTLVGRLNVSGSRIHVLGVDEGREFETKLKADYKKTVSVGISYLGLSLNLSLNPAKLLGKYNDYEIGMHSYGKRFGYDVSYQDAHNFKGWHEVEGVKQDITTSDDMFRLRTFSANAYYVFNSRRFSYPAAFAHSYIQRQSAGSFLLAASAMGQKGEISNEDGEGSVNIPSAEFRMTNIGIGAGYGYNFVPNSSHRGDWLIHFSVLPTLLVYTKSSITIGETDTRLERHFPEGLVTTRAAVVRQIGRNKFVGLSAVYDVNSIGHRDKMSIRNQKWFARLYFGLRL